VNRNEDRRSWIRRCSKSIGPNGYIDAFDATAASAEIIVLAVKGTAAVDALRLAGTQHLAEKTIIDITNPTAEINPSAEQKDITEDVSQPNVWAESGSLSTFRLSKSVRRCESQTEAQSSPNHHGSVMGLPVTKRDSTSHELGNGASPETVLHPSRNGDVMHYGSIAVDLGVDLDFGSRGRTSEKVFNVNAIDAELSQNPVQNPLKTLSDLRPQNPVQEQGKSKNKDEQADQGTQAKSLEPPP
jgi:hypothetical protein